MKKCFLFVLVFVFSALCGCKTPKENSKSTRFLFNTVVTLDVACDNETLSQAFSLCEEYENRLSKTVKTSEVYRLNHSDDYVSVSDDTVYLIKKAVEYAEISDGDFDITICPVSDLYDFEGDSLPPESDINEAVKRVDYRAISIDGNRVCLNGKQIDLGGIAKGYIADKLLEFFKAKKVKSGIINLGGNVYVFGEKMKTIGIAKPFDDTKLAGKIKVKNLSVVTSGTYQRYIKKDGRIYHHILDPETGYARESDLDSATVIGKSSLDCDCLATICILKGQKEAKNLIDFIPETEGIFIDKNGKQTYTSGLSKTDGVYIKN